jgi:hypothetical protein
MMRKNVIRIVFQNSDRKSVPGKGTKNTKTLQGLRPVTFGAPIAMALYNQGSGIAVLQMNRMCPRPEKGTGLAQGGREAFNKTRN